MENEIVGLVQQANVITLNYIVATTSNDELKQLEMMIQKLESRLTLIRANLEEESSILDITHNSVAHILAKVKNKPLPSAMKGARYQPSVVTPNRATPSRKAVSFDIKSSSPLSSLSLPDTQQQRQQVQSPLAPSSVTTSIGRLAQSEFDLIPKYMKGRLTLEKINTMVDLLNQLYTEKYAIMTQNPNKLPHEYRQRYWDWKEVDCDEIQDRYFITEADIKANMQNAAAKQNTTLIFKLDPLGRSILAILRHFGRIREVRTPGVVRFVIL